MTQVTYTSLASAVMRDIERWIEMRDKRSVRLFLSAGDKLRVLKFRIWGFRYKLTTAEILDLVVPALRKGIVAKGKKSGLGVKIATVTGSMAESILQDRVKERYPDGAHIAAWKEQQRDEQRRIEAAEELDGIPLTVKRQKTLLESESVQAFSEAYRARLLKIRRDTRREGWRKRKQYRGNPWL